MSTKIVIFHNEHDDGIEFLVPIDYSEKIPRIPLSKELEQLHVCGFAFE